MADDNPYVPNTAESVFGPSSNEGGGQAVGPEALEILHQSLREMGFQISENVGGNVAESVRSILESQSGMRHVTARLRSMERLIRQMPAGEERTAAIEQFRTMQSGMAQLGLERTSPLYTARGQDEYAREQVMNLQPKTDEEQRRQTTLNFARSEFRRQGELTQSLATELEGYRDALKEEAEKKQAQLNASDDPAEVERLRQEVTELNNETSSFEEILRRQQNQQSQENQKMLGFLGNVVGSLAMGQLATQFILQDPFRYQTAPAMQAAGRTSELGSVVSQAIMAEAEYSLGLNTTAMQTGMGMMALGGGAAINSVMTPEAQRNPNTRRFGRAGAAAAVMGGVVTGLGVTQTADDILQGLDLAATEDEIIGNQIAKEILNAPRIANFYQTSRAGLLQVGAGPELGFTAGAEGGNTVLSGIANQDTASGFTLGQLGYSTTDVGGLLSSASLQLRGSEETLTQAVQLSGNMQALFGVSEEQTFANLSSIQRAGFAPGEANQMYMRSMGVFADDEGGLSNFAANVLVPALNQVLESTAIQNAARSTEELARDVYGFRQTLQGDDRLGQLIEATPEAYNQIYQDVQQTVKQGAQDPAMLGFYRSLGLSFSDIYSGSPRVTAAALNYFVDTASASGRLTADSSQEEIFAMIAPFARSGVLGMTNIQTAVQLVQRGLQGETLNVGMVEGSEALTSEEMRERGAGLPQDLTELLEMMATSTSEFNEQTNNNVDALIAMQEKIQEFVDSDDFESKLDSGISRVLSEFYKMLGEDDLAEIYGSRHFNATDNAVDYVGGNGGRASSSLAGQHLFNSIAQELGMDSAFTDSGQFTLEMANLIANQSDLIFKMQQDFKDDNDFDEEYSLPNSEPESVTTGKRTSGLENVNPGRAQDVVAVELIKDQAIAIS